MESFLSLFMGQYAHYDQKTFHNEKLSIKCVAVLADQFYCNVCLCHGVFLSFVGALPPPCLRSVVQADALEVVVAFADFRVVCLDRLAVVGSLLFLFFASHANHLGVEH